MNKIVKNRKLKTLKYSSGIPKFVTTSNLFWIGSILLLAIFAYAVGKSSNNNKEIPTTDNSLQYIQTVTPTTEPTSTPSESVKVTKKVVPTATPTIEKLIDCHIPDQCGGGVRELKAGECSQLICCRISGNTYSAINKTECDRIHENNKTNTVTDTQNTTTKVAFTTNYATVKGTFYCSQLAVNQLLNQQESVVQQDYELMQSSCDTQIEILKSHCQSNTDAYKKSQSTLDGYIREFCP